MSTHDMRMTPTDLRGIDSGRVRYRVECLTCRVVVHEATTGPIRAVEQHFVGQLGYSRPMTEDEVRTVELTAAEARDHRITVDAVDQEILNWARSWVECERTQALDDETWDAIDALAKVRRIPLTLPLQSRHRRGREAPYPCAPSPSGTRDGLR